MAEKRMILSAISLLFTAGVVCSENNNSNEATPNKWKHWGEPYGCERGYVAVNIENQKPVKGACVPIGYDTNQRPNPSSITKVYTSFNRLKILNVEEKDKTFTIEVKTSSIWADPRIKTTLKNNNSYIKLTPDVDIPKVWIPLSIPNNVKMFKSTLDPFLYTELRFFFDKRISPSSTLLNLTIEYRLTIYCDFDFQMFPFDTHSCNFLNTILDSDKIQVQLYDPSNHSLHSRKNYNTAGFDVSIDFCNYTNGIGFEIQLKRLKLSYLLQYYLPCFSIVMISFISFIVPLSAIPGRIGLTVTQFLTLTNVFIHQLVSSYVSSRL